MTRGRLLKKNEQDRLKSLHVDSYPWKDFSTESILLPDNPRKSVVLAKSHPSQELQQKVLQPAEFTRTFGSPARPLYPEDMTAEFLASQEELRQRKRRMQMDEEDAVALELLDLDEDKPEEQQKSSESEENISPGAANAGAAASVSFPGGRNVGPDISDLSKLAAHKNKAFEGGLEFSASQANQQSQQQAEAEVQAAFERGLAQGRAEGEKSGYELGHAQALRESTEAMQALRTEQVQEAHSDKNYEEGIQEGLAQGRQQAVAEAEQKYAHSMALFTKALSELAHLKGELLSTGREIFAEIAQICAEKVLRKSVLLNDVALSQVYTAAMAQFQSQDQIKIEMHPDDVSRLEAEIALADRGRIRLVGNAKLERGDMKIEANNEVVTFDVHKTVEAVIDSLKDELFEASKDDDSSEKAG
ncbi:hypothetical protein EBU99_12670 [bacterium]|nr:hypothetical protein [bacterium]